MIGVIKCRRAKSGTHTHITLNPMLEELVKWTFFASKRLYYLTQFFFYPMLNIYWNCCILPPRIRNNVPHSWFIWNLKCEFLIREGKKELTRLSLLEFQKTWIKKNNNKKKKRQSLWASRLLLQLFSHISNVKSACVCMCLFFRFIHSYFTHVSSWELNS